MAIQSDPERWQEISGAIDIQFHLRNMGVIGSERPSIQSKGDERLVVICFSQVF